MFLVRRQVSIEQAEKFAQDNRIALTFETSSKNDINVKGLFEEIAKQVFVGYLSKRRQSQLTNPKTSPYTINQSESKKKICC